jgi:hemerythrin-like domain-containing protein
MSAPRQNLYTAVHKGIRRQLSEMLTLTGMLDFEDSRQRNHFNHRLAGLAAMLESHAHHEDKHIAPLIERAAPELGRRIGATHQVLEQTMERMRGILARMETQPETARALGHELYLALARYVATQFDHMDEEEGSVMGALWAAYSDEELNAMNSALLADIPPQEMGVWLSWMVPTLAPFEQQGMIEGMRNGAPPEVLAFVESLALQSQSERESKLAAA